MNKRSFILNAWKNRLLTGLLLVLMVALVALPQGVLAGEVPPSTVINPGPKIGVDHPANPGDVMLFKQVTPVPGMVNTWDITLRVEAKDTVQTSDTIIVLDTSGSMGGLSGRLSAAKAAAISLVDLLLTEENVTNRVAVVSFATESRTRQAFTTDAQDVENAINRLSATGGTFTQAGMHRAISLMSGSTATHKNIVLLSDGQPTFSFEIDQAWRSNTDNLIKY